MSASRDPGLFDGGPPLKLQEWLGLIRPGQPNIARRTALAALIGWLPLAVLTAVTDPDALASFASDFGVHARSLITVPLFILAEVLVAPRLGAIAQHFLDAGMVVDTDRARFAAAQRSTLRWRDSVVVEALVIVLAYAIVVAFMTVMPTARFLSWQKTGSGASSIAGWWHALVSVPLLIVLFLGWMWRLFLWTRFLWLISRLDLRLIPAHPDHAAGLLFVGYSVRSCSVIGCALGALVAGTVATGVASRGASPMDYRNAILNLVIFVVILVCGPLLMFTGKLLQQWRRGVFEYGTLADGLGQRFEGKWLQRKAGDDILEVPDFSAATDLYQVVGNVYEVHAVPVDRKSIILLVIATLLPFVPVLLMAVPLDTLFSDLGNLLF